MTIATRKPTAQRRLEIARAALYVAGTRGPRGLTTSVLAGEVGLTTGALFRHFRDWDDILREATRVGIARLEETFPDPSLPPLQRLVGLASNRVRLLGSDPGLAWLVRSEQATTMLPKDAAEALRALVEKSGRYLLEALQDARAAGELRTDVDPKALVPLVSGTVHALIGAPGIHGEVPEMKSRDPAPVLDALLRLLAPPPSASAHERGRTAGPAEESGPAGRRERSDLTTPQEEKRGPTR